MEFRGIRDRLEDPYNRNLVAFSIILAAIIAYMPLLHSIAASNDEVVWKNVYNVYINDEYIGTVSDKVLVDNALDAYLETLKKRYAVSTLSLEGRLTYIEEKKSKSSRINNQETIQSIKEHVDVHMDAVVINIDEKPVVYLATKEEAEEVLLKLKEKYLSKEERQEVNELEIQQSTSLPTIKENETRLLDVSFLQNVSINEKIIHPSTLSSMEDSVELLEKGTLVEETYKVKEGDVLGSIAKEHQLDLEKLLALNPELNEDSVLAIDQELHVTNLKSLVDVVLTKETRLKEKLPYKEETIEDKNLYKGQTEIKQEGKDGQRLVTYEITEINGKETDSKEKEEVILQEPTAKIIIKGTKVIPSRGDGEFSWPAQGGYISSEMEYRWGKYHKGIDIARPSGKAILAADNGVVESAGYDNSGYGNKVVINHQNGYKTVYAHLESIEVKTGENVPKGTPIGVMGSTGNSTGVHLHFEMYKNASLVNPLDYIR